jgi:hypothetical protein
VFFFGGRRAIQHRHEHSAMIAHVPEAIRHEAAGSYAPDRVPQKEARVWLAGEPDGCTDDESAPCSSESL